MYESFFFLVDKYVKMTSAQKTFKRKKMFKKKRIPMKLC